MYVKAPPFGSLTAALAYTPLTTTRIKCIAESTQAPWHLRMTGIPVMLVLVLKAAEFTGVLGN